MRDFDFRELLEFKPEEGTITLKDNRMVLFHVIALDFMKDELIRSLGGDLARGVLTRLGYRCGYHDAMMVASTYGKEIRFIGLGAIMQKWRGIGKVSFEEEQIFCLETGDYRLKGRWENSPEAEYYIDRYGKSKHPVCWISAGYASGFVSGFTGLDIICIESKCMGQGDPYCGWEMRAVKNWGELADKHLRYYKGNFNYKSLQTMLAEERSIDIHRRLTQLVLEEHGIDVIAATLNEIVKCPVIILNKNLDLIAGCKDNEIEAQQLIFLKKYLTDEQKYRNNQQVIKIEQPVESGVAPVFAVSPIIAGSKSWGFIAVLETTELTELEMVAIEHACTVCAIDNLKQDSAIETELRLKGDLLDDIFSINEEKDNYLAHKALRLGCDLAKPHRVMVVDLINEGGNKRNSFSPDFIVKIVKSGIGSLAEKIAPDSLVAARRNRVVIIICTDDATIHIECAKLIQDWVAGNIAQCSVNITWGRECFALTEYKQSFEEAWEASDILKSLGKKNELVGYDELGIYTILWESGKQDKIKEFALSKLGRLLDYDEKHSTNLLKTLEIYLQKNCSLKETAAEAFIHINSLKYRLKRIKELTGLNLASEEDRFQCQLSLRLLKTLT